ncbi:hypothetical protein ACFYNY_19990 [Streptomyces sp. NPDC006530]|uniref:hypothetical protein n=1 Tax=Streptomyces sp. NPDC006530 TaxID=3364750 RepID=UPI0036ABDBD7
MANNGEGGWRPRDSKHPWRPPKEGRPLHPESSDGPGRSRTPQSVGGWIALIAMILWTLGAIQWNSQGCTFFPTSYRLVIQHGFPSSYDKCSSETEQGTVKDN